ncbi:hypothetical protein M9Y10_031473 [Tritrichomonas musculus]|uniref:Uncharacterized protein n=1 Tax=Tritrichomonas musculus TaxID=1915356 RepID=A0ABR2GL68_9EUKA
MQRALQRLPVGRLLVGAHEPLHLADHLLVDDEYALYLHSVVQHEKRREREAAEAASLEGAAEEPEYLRALLGRLAVTLLPLDETYGLLELHVTEFSALLIVAQNLAEIEADFSCEQKGPQKEAFFQGEINDL